MAGVGVRLNRIFQKNTLTTHIVGFGYSAIITVAPMAFMILAIFAMQVLLEVSKTGYSMRELFASTILYIFIFSLLTSAPFNSVLSRYMADAIYDERFEDVMPCYYVGMFFNIGLGSFMAIPFCLREHYVGGVDSVYVFVSYMAFMALVLVFYSMLYLNVFKDYKKISLFFLIGMSSSVAFAYLFRTYFQFEVTFSMLLGLAFGFLIIAVLEYALIRSYFRENSAQYQKVVGYFKEYWILMITNCLYIVGLYVHNLVFWTTDMHVVVAKSFVTMSSYDMATCLAMFTNLSASIIFISRIEMFFHARYKAYSEAVIGGRGIDIKNAKNRMFRQLAEEISNLARIQFIITVVIYFIFVVILPQYGFGGMVMQIYPCLTVGYFILFVMYGTIIFLYYFNDLKGAMMTAGIFLASTLLATYVATHLPTIWYGVGLVIGAFTGWCVGYFRLRWLERNLDEHVFCNGSILKKGKGEKPNALVYKRGGM